MEYTCIIREGEITWVNGCVFTLAISSLPASFQPEGPTGGLYGGGLSNGSCCFGNGCILAVKMNVGVVVGGTLTG